MSSIESAPLFLRHAGGNGEPVLLLHGFGADRQSWLGVTPDLQQRAATYILDLPGHGASPLIEGPGDYTALLEPVAACIELLGPQPVHLVGHSLGGGLAIALAARFPRQVASLALAAPAGLGSGIQKGFLTTFAELDNAPAALQHVRQLVADPRLMGSQIAELLLSRLAVPGVRNGLASIAAHMPATVESVKTQLQAVVESDIPTMVVWGEADIVNPANTHAVAAFTSNVHYLDACGHLPHVEKRSVFCRLLAEFHSGISRSSAAHQAGVA